jgi:hypothetical protein
MEPDGDTHVAVSAGHCTALITKCGITECGPRPLYYFR